jgi:hypothetical protein
MPNPYDPSTHYAGSHQPPADPQAVTWQASGSGETPVAEAFSLLQSAAKEHGAFLERIEGVKDQFTNDGLRQQLSNFSGSQAGQVPDAVDRFCDEYNQAAEAEVAAALRGVATPGDAAQEQRNSRAVDRAERVLADASDGEKQIAAAQLLADAHADTVGALAVELPSMGVEPSVIEQALVSKLPELKAHYNRRDKVRQSTAVLRNDAGMLRRSIQGGSKLRVGVVDPTPYDPDK